MPPALDETKREEMMAEALRHRLPRIDARPIGEETLTVVGYGPSLADTWHKVKPPLITVSGSLNFLLSKGMKPELGKWFHADCDPRPHKIDLIKPARDDIIYLMASVCNPNTWKELAGKKVIMWHAVSGRHTKQWVEENDPGQWLIGAGSTVGLSAIHLGGFLGFRKFEIHGFDGCFRGDDRHAGPHGGFKHKIIEREFGGKVYKTSKIMDNANHEVAYLLDKFPIFCVFHGEGLMQHWVSTMDLPNAAVDGTEKADSVRNGRYIPLHDVVM